MKFPAILLFIIAAAVSAYGIEWYDNLPPGITRIEIVQIAGAPASTILQMKAYDGQSREVEYLAQIDRYELKDGYIELIYDNDELIQCTRYSVDGEHQRTPYIHARSLSPVQMQARKDYLTAREFALRPKFDWNFIRTHKYPDGVCYRIDGSFLIIVPILPAIGESGFFADKTAKVTLLDAKRNETVLYRAIDNWKNLRPPQLDDERIEERTRLIAALEKQNAGNRIPQKILGPADSSMGSGIPYVVYYLEDSLAIGIYMGEEIAIVSIDRPGESIRSLSNECSQK